MAHVTFWAPYFFLACVEASNSSPLAAGGLQRLAEGSPGAPRKLGTSFKSPFVVDDANPCVTHHVYTHIYIYIHVQMSMYTDRCLYIHIYRYVYVYIHIHVCSYMFYYNKD